MSKARLGIAGVALVALLTLPRAASANGGDIIWGMSGPQMIGIGILHCEVTFGTSATNATSGNVNLGLRKCATLPKNVIELLATADKDIVKNRHMWLAFDADVYWSTGKDSKNGDYDALKIWMVALDPMLEVKSVGSGNYFLHHGVIGMSYNLFAGPDFRVFDNVGLKFQPIEVTLHHVEISYTVRVYPKRFTPEQFGVKAKRLEQGAEFARGFTISFLY